MRVHIPSPLHSYTQADTVEAQGATLDALLLELDRRYPGIRFRMIDEQQRMRAHIRFFINGEQVHELSRSLSFDDDVVIVQALSGG